MKFREIRESDCNIIISPENNDFPPEDHFDSGDPEFDKEDCKRIRENAEWNIWAWCCVKVSMTFAGLQSCAYLGGSSYLDEEDFMNDGYYEDMKSECLEDLNKQLKEMLENLRED
jgi:hypothetical protein